MSEKLPYRTLETISQVLLTLCAVLTAISLSLFIKVWSERHSTKQLQARLLSQVELQTQLLA